MSAAVHAILSCIVLPLVWLATVIYGRRRRNKKSKIPRPGHLYCGCGYPLVKLDVPRCPECGCVIGFNATPEELGLELSHLQRIAAAQARRRAERAAQTKR